uniref:Putative myosin light chain binding protein n=1 Tax=Hyalomma excavatum TaxID=257692 RepID=A0A131XFL6_9ACAR
MCDICHVFGKSASELNEHLTSEGHKEALRKFLKGEKSPPAEDVKVEDKPTEVTESEDKKPKQEDKKNKTPELYCDVCQLLLPSLGTKREHENSKKHKFLQELRKKAKSGSHSQEASAKKKAEVKKAVTAERTVPSGKPLHCSVCQMDLDTSEAMEEHIQSKKHKFLSELKPTPPVPARRPEEGSRHKRAGPRDSGPDRHERRHGKRQSEEEEEIPELAAVALERRALQAQLVQRRQEIEEQHRLIAALREEQQLEAEKAALRRMISECRRLIEEREKNKRRAAEAEERALRKAAKSVQWHPSVTEGKDSRDSRQIRSHDYDEPHERLSLVKKAQEDWEREHLEQAKSRSLAQQKHSVHVNREEDDWERDNPSGGSSLGYTSFSNWDGKIPLLDTAVETDDNATSWSASLPFESRESAPTFRNPLADKDRMMNPFCQEPHFRQVDVGAVFSQETLGNSGANWPGAVHSPPVWSNISEELRDWNRPVLCTPPNSVALLGDKAGPMRDEHSPFGEKTSLLGSRPSLLEDRPSLLAEKPSLLGSRPGLLEERPTLLVEKPGLLGSRPSLLEDRPSTVVEKPSLLGSRPSFVEDRLTLLVEQPNLGSRPSLLEDRPSTVVEKPSLLGSGPSLLEDRPSFVTEKPSLLGSRPGLLEDRPGLLDGRPSFSGSRPVLLEDRPSILDDRPSLLEDRPGFHDRPALSAGRPGLLEDRPSFLDGRPGFLGGRPSLLGDKPGLLGERPEQQSQLWGYPSQRPAPEPEPWGGSSSVRIPGLDLV